MASVFDTLFQSVSEELTQRAEEADNRPKHESGDFEKSRWFPFKAGKKDGKYQFGVFLIPFLTEEKKFKTFHVTYSHNNLPPLSGEDDIGVRKCIAKSNPEEGVACAFCEVLENELEHRKGKEKRKEIHRMKPSGKAYVNVLPIQSCGERVDPEEFPYLPHIAKLPAKQYDNIAQYLRDQDCLSDPTLNPLNPNNAGQLLVTVERTGPLAMNVRYDCKFGIRRTPIAETEEDRLELINKAYDLTKIMRSPSAEELKAYRKEAVKLAAILATKRQDDDDDDDIPAPKAKKVSEPKEEDETMPWETSSTESEATSVGPTGPKKVKNIVPPDFQ
jgi:hypothetical protein